jgi:hypothetical protein
MKRCAWAVAGAALALCAGPSLADSPGKSVAIVPVALFGDGQYKVVFTLAEAGGGQIPVLSSSNFSIYWVQANGGPTNSQTSAGWPQSIISRRGGNVLMVTYEYPGNADKNFYLELFSLDTSVILKHEKEVAVPNPPMPLPEILIPGKAGQFTCEATVVAGFADPKIPTPTPTFRVTVSGEGGFTQTLGPPHVTSSSHGQKLHLTFTVPLTKPGRYYAQVGCRYQLLAFSGYKFTRGQ